MRRLVRLLLYLTLDIVDAADVVAVVLLDVDLRLRVRRTASLAHYTIALLRQITRVL